MNMSLGRVEPKSGAPTSLLLATTVVVFVLTLSAASSVGLVPDFIDGSTPLTTGGTQKETLSQETAAVANFPELGSEHAVAPERVEIAQIDLDLAVQNPETRDLAELDELLRDGPARYVDSAKLGEEGGNMIIFAHSSSLPVVCNQMYKAFNRTSELKAGDSITIEGEGRNYLYMVTKVYKADASDTRIDIRKDLGTRLTLVTRDTLTSKDARFALEASLVGTYQI